MFSSKGFIVLALTSRSLIHFELISVLWCEVGVVLLHVATQLPLGHLLKTILSSWSCLDILVENQVTSGRRACLWTLFYSADLRICGWMSKRNLLIPPLLFLFTTELHGTLWLKYLLNVPNPTTPSAQSMPVRFM